MGFLTFLRHSPEAAAAAPSSAAVGQLCMDRCCSVHTGKISPALHSVQREFAQALLLQGVSVEECESRTKQ